MIDIVRRQERNGEGTERQDCKMYTYQWRKASKEFLKRHLLCSLRERRKTHPATGWTTSNHTVVTETLLEQNNWQPLWQSCHSRRPEDGGRKQSKPRGVGVWISTEVAKRQRAGLCEKSQKIVGYIPIFFAIFKEIIS